jgi:hypothetical protein
MRPHRKQSVTLMELLICMALLGMVVLGVFSIDTFSRHHLTDSGNRAKVQSDVSLILEHMARNIPLAVGDTDNYPLRFQASRRLLIRIDSNQNGILDSNDNWVCYGKDNIAGSILQYCSNYSESIGSCYIDWDTLSSRIVSNINSTYMIFNNTTNFLTVNITGCLYPLRSDCGSAANPIVNMSSRIKMPSVSSR